MADDTFNNDNQESLMGDDEFTEVVEATVEDVEETGETVEESLEAKINHGIGTLDINVGKVSETDFAREMRTSFLEYSMSVIVARALPDVRDGLKPVHRRILYAMNESGITPNKPHVKSARPVGDCMGKYHPHGDAAIYDTLVRLAQDFSMRVPLIDGHGNFGSIDGDSRRGHALHRSAPQQAGHGAARRPREGDGRLAAQLRRVDAGAQGAPRALPQPARQRLRRHRRRHGDEHPAA